MEGGEDDDGIAAPEGGWPPALKYCRVLATQKKSKSEYKIVCLKCGYKSGFSTLLRVAAHHLHIDGKGIARCETKPVVLEAQDPEFVAFLKRQYPSLLAKQQTTLSFKPSPKETSGSMASGSIASGGAPSSGAANDPIPLDGGTPLGARQFTMEWMLKPPEEKERMLKECHKAWSLFFFANNIPFQCIESNYFKDAIKKTKDTPTYEPVTARTLSTSHLDLRDKEATEYRESLINAGLEFGLWMSGDGYKSKPTKRQWHNYILGCVLGVFVLLFFMCDPVLTCFVCCRTDFPRHEGCDWPLREFRNHHC